MQPASAPGPAMPVGPRPAQAAKGALSSGAGGTGFTALQLSVLRSQILAFRSLKVGLLFPLSAESSQPMKAFYKLPHPVHMCLFAAPTKAGALRLL